jgi:hypothetical protein
MSQVSYFDTWQTLSQDKRRHGSILFRSLARWRHSITEEITMDRLLARLPLWITLAAGLALLAHGPIAQWAHYHDFADQRTALGLPRAADVLSNAGFALLGLWGLWRLWPKRRDPLIRAGWPGYCLFLIALTLTAIGSSYYHLAPDNARLLWDRLPIALACAGLLAGVRAETQGGSNPWLETLGFAMLAVASVLWWSFTERQGAGDLRPYLLVQGLPILLIPLWQAIHREPAADRRAFALGILLYVVAKAAELHDHECFDRLGWISGHTLKHLLATAAAGVLIHRLVQRNRASSAHPPREDHRAADDGVVRLRHDRGRPGGIEGLQKAALGGHHQSPEEGAPALQEHDIPAMRGRHARVDEEDLSFVVTVVSPHRLAKNR